jgi:antitoxin ChpS
MHLTTLRNVGGSVMFTIPKPILESLGLLPNAQVGLSVSKGRLIIEPNPQRRYVLADLIGQCEPSLPLADEDRTWLGTPPAGREEI